MYNCMRFTLSSPTRNPRPYDRTILYELHRHTYGRAGNLNLDNLLKIPSASSCFKVSFARNCFFE